MRIFHGLYNIAGIPSIMARAERSLGVDSTAVCFPAANPAYVPDILEQPGYQPSDHLQRFRRYADDFDVFVFHFGFSLVHDSLADIPFLKNMGKTVIFYFHGCDIRQNKETIRKYRFSACRDCWPHSCNANRDLALEVATRYADAIWVSTPDLLEFVPGSILFQQPFDVRSVEFRSEDHIWARRGEIVSIVHAPSDRMLKGTKYLLSAIKKLRFEGFPVRLELIEKLPQKQAIECFKQADIAVDQLLFGSYGMFSVELMAIGVPVICFLREDLIPRYPERPPMAVADPSTIGSVIQDFVAKRDEWPAIARAARTYVERRHDSRVLAEQAIKTYRSLRGTSQESAVVPGRSAVR